MKGAGSVDGAVEVLRSAVVHVRRLSVDDSAVALYRLVVRKGAVGSGSADVTVRWTGIVLLLLAEACVQNPGRGGSQRKDAET